MRIDASGNVGIGKTPSGFTGGKLDVAGFGYFNFNATNEYVRVGATSGGTAEIYRNAGDLGYTVETSYNHKWYTGGTERMRIDSSGNVGIGRTPDQRLQIAAPTAVQYDMFVGSTRTLTLYADATQTIIGNPTAVPMIFRTSDTERFRIASSGETTFTGNTTFSAANFAGKLGTAAGYGYWSNSDVTSFIQINGSSNAVPYRVYVAAQSNGVYMAANATSWTANSDARLKNITGTFTNALADVLQIQAVKFTWKSDVENRPCVGLIAQSVEKVLPEAVSKGTMNNSEDKTEYLGVQYTEVIPLLVAAIQELKTTVDAQAAQIAALESN
jgi:hypothetical protein